MAVLNKLVSLVSEVIWRHRYHWVEISVERAWSRDMPPRTFDLQPTKWRRS